MGKHGRKSKHASGVGYTTEKGYHRLSVWDSETKSVRVVMAHVWAWEQQHGPIPEGYQIHHRNGDKQDNRLENLEIVDPTTHKRLHNGCELRAGIWWKPCPVCGEFKPIDAEHWYLSKEGWPLYGKCRPCHIARVVRDKQERRRSRAEKSASMH
jgi:hypothetical protein